MKLTASLLFSTFVLLAAPLAATTFVMVPDEDLADQAAAVVEARVLTVDGAPGDGTPATDYLDRGRAGAQGEHPGQQPDRPGARAASAPTASA